MYYYNPYYPIHYTTLYTQFPLHPRVPATSIPGAPGINGAVRRSSKCIFVLLQLGIPCPPFPLLTLPVANHRVSIPWVTRSCFLFVPHTYLC